MDTRWTITDWNPSALPRSSWVKSPEKEIKDVMNQLPRLTKELAQHAYSPRLWLERSRLLLILGYPELAVGDAYKAKLLCGAFDAPQDLDLMEKVKCSMGLHLNRFQRLTTIRSKQKEAIIDSNELVLNKIKLGAYRKLVLGLEQTCSFGEAMYHCRLGISEFPLDSFLHQRLQYLQNTSRKCKHGGFMIQNYPWARDEQLKRTAAVLSESVVHLKGISNGKCTLMESTLSPQNSSRKKTVRWIDQTSSKPLARICSNRASGTRASWSISTPAPSWPATRSDFLGVFAREAIKAGSHILTDITITGVASVKTFDECENCYGILGPLRFSQVCCNAEYCSPLCRDLANGAYHRATCGRINTTNAPISQHTGTYDTCHQAYNDIDLDIDLYNRLLLRFLASSTASKSHPLQHETAARLASPSNSVAEVPFSLINSIITPLRMLRALNVDIFSNFDFDTWILMTLWYRIHIHIHRHTTPHNRNGSLIAIHPCFSFFNHSCKPNACWRFVDNSSNIQVWAERDIQEGEEIFVSYIDLSTTKRKGKLQREQELQQWLRGPCKCIPCMAEAE